MVSSLRPVRMFSNHSTCMSEQSSLVIPDIHHKTQVIDKIRAAHDGIPAIFLGDYFDDFGDTVADMRATCHWLRTALENTDDVFLLGNHCFAYLSYELGVRWGFCTGWTAAKQQVFHEYFHIFPAMRSCIAAGGSYGAKAG
jgi:hypothetical protein